MGRYIRSCWELNLKDLENVSTDLPVVKVLIGITVVLCLAQIYLGVERITLAKLLRRLRKKGAVGEENALTTVDLGITKKTALRMLKNGSHRLMQNVGCLTPEDGDVKYFIPTDRLPAAEEYLSRSETSPLRIALSCLMTVSIAVCLSLIMPTLLNALDTLLSFRF